MDGSIIHIKSDYKEDRYIKLLNSIKNRVSFNYKLSEIFRSIFGCLKGIKMKNL